MLFASFDFLLFFLPVLAAFWALRHWPKWRWVLLLLASYFFYVAGPAPAGATLPAPWYFLGFLVLSTLVDYAAALAIHNTRSQRAKNTWLGVSLALNLGLLGYFKYTGFLLQVATDLAAVSGLPWAAPSFSVLLPLGISFYTFQSLTYTIDVWRGRLAAERSLLNFAVYIAFFPQLVAGPIVRAVDFLPQLRARLILDRAEVDIALWRIAKGLLKKVILGDFIAAYFTDVVFSDPTAYSSLENLLALYAFTLQIYADFSGYSDIAIGVARLLGFKLPENFDRPYQAKDVGEFWRRWHMTLSAWLRDYLFFPLGGSRGSLARTYFNVWLTMFLIGMWHGATYNFLIYGNLHAFALLFHRTTIKLSAASVRSRALGTLGLGAAAFAGSWVLLYWPLQMGTPGALFGAAVSAGCAIAVALLPSGAAWTPLHVLLTFHFTVLSRVFFRADSLDQASQMVQKLVTWDGLGVRDGLFRAQAAADWFAAHGLGNTALGQLANVAILLLLICGLGLHFVPAKWTDGLGTRCVARAPAPIVGLGFALIAWLISVALSGPRANIYFAF